MIKALSHPSSFDSPSAGLVRVCLALAKTDSKAAWQDRNREKTIGADLNRHPAAIQALARRPPRMAPA